MRDQWINIGYEDDKLKPFAEPSLFLDQKRIGMLIFAAVLIIPARQYICSFSARYCGFCYLKTDCIMTLILCDLLWLG